MRTIRLLMSLLVSTPFAAAIITDNTFPSNSQKPPLTNKIASVVPACWDNWEEEEVRTLLDLWKDAHVQSELDGSGRNIIIYWRLADHCP